MPGAPKILGPRPGSAKRAAKLNSTGLGRSLVKDAKATKTSGGHTERHVMDPSQSNEPGWVKLQSKTQERPLDEFLSTAELNDTDFTTERSANIKIIQSGGQEVENPFLLTDEQKENLVQRHYENAGKLTVPRRPRWTKEMTAHELDRLEKEAFLSWRRSLAELQDDQELLLTPFERNIEVWRQLWRVVERSDLVVQIVDARNPVLFRSVDLDKYVTEVDPRKRTLLLVNKADMLSEEQRQTWGAYFKEHGLDYIYFSAKSSLTDQELAEQRAHSESQSDSVTPEPTPGLQPKSESDDGTIPVLSADELEALFIERAPEPREGRPLQIGLVGYPNVGKSSTINALIGAKKVSVSSTPGKTKHFQTIQLSPKVTLCDCPGLVFPNFAQTSGELVVNGVLPIDQLRESLSPVEIVCQRIPKFFLEAVYGIHIFVKPEDEGGNGVPTALELLNSYARARGYWRTGGGDPDVSRAARYVLKDYVNGVLVYCESPPDTDGTAFNVHKYTLSALSDHRRAQIVEAIHQAHHGENIDVSTVDLAKEMSALKFSAFDSTGPGNAARRVAQASTTGAVLDRDFFATSQDSGTPLMPFHQRQQMAAGSGSKKHFKGNKKKKPAA